MSTADFDPLQLRVEAFAKNEQSLAGEWPLSLFPRLLESSHAQRPLETHPNVQWQIRGESRATRSGAPETWLHLTAKATVVLTCQRCLQGMTTQVNAQRSFRFVHGETAAADSDAQSEEDVLALTRHLNVRELTEDELLLELPLVPRHEVCAEPLLQRDMGHVGSGELPRENPFAALAQFKGGKRPS